MTILTPGVHVNTKIYISKERLLIRVHKVNTCEQQVTTVYKVHVLYINLFTGLQSFLLCNPRIGGESGGGLGKVNFTVYSLGLLSSSGASWLSSS